MKGHTPLILASASAIRADILQRIGLQFDVIPAHINERQFAPLDAIGLAKAKAMAISQRYPNRWVIGADQICHLNGQVFHKPGTVENATKTLSQLQGQTHTLLTAAALAINSTCAWAGMDTVSLNMKPLSATDIHNYVRTDAPLNSCGAYCYEKNGQALFTWVSHPKESIQGLPLQQLVGAIQRHAR